MGQPIASDKETGNRPLPVIDFSAWSNTSSSARRLEVARELVESCHRTGFVYLANHGIAPSLVKEAFIWSKRLFDLPLDQKAQAARDESTAIFRGYNAPGLQRVPLKLRVRGGDPEASGFSPDWNETFDLGSEDNSDKPNRWPSEHLIPNFRQFATNFYGECWNIVQNVLHALALGLGIDEVDMIARFHSYHGNELSFKHYPSVPALDFQSHEKERLGSHSDMDSVTLLFLDDVGGLEVERQGKKGEFVPVDLIEGTLVMNIGDILMRWSNDFLLSTVHRVQPPRVDPDDPESKMTPERYSIVYFVSPVNDAVIECLPGCFDEKNPAKYPPRSHKQLESDYSRLFYPDAKA